MQTDGPSDQKGTPGFFNHQTPQYQHQPPQHPQQHPEMSLPYHNSPPVRPQPQQPIAPFTNWDWLSMSKDVADKKRLIPEQVAALQIRANQVAREAAALGERFAVVPATLPFTNRVIPEAVEQLARILEAKPYYYRCQYVTGQDGARIATTEPIARIQNLTGLRIEPMPE